MAKKFFASLLFVCILSFSAYADLVYTTDNGTMGFIEIYNTSDTLSIDIPVEQYSGIDENSIAVHYYNDDGTSFVALIEPETDINNSSGDKAYIFNASDLTKPVNDEATILTGVYNTRSTAYSDNHRSLYFASGVDGEARITEFNTSNLELQRRYSYTNSKDNAFTSTVLVNGSSVFGLVNKATSQDSLFLRFDGQINAGAQGSWNVKAKYDSELATLGSDSRILVAHSGGVDQLINNEFKLIVSTDTPVKALCRDNDKGFYFITQSDDTGRQVLKHYKNDTSIAEEVDDGTGFICKAVYYDKDNKKFVAVIIDDSIVIYDPEDDSILGEFDSTELGGSPISITGITQNTSSTKDSGKSSGCNITGAGILLILSGYILIRKRKG